MRILIIGLGTVGQGLLEILRDKHTYLEEHHRFVPEVVAVATHTRGTLYHPDGLDIEDLLAALQKGGHLDVYPEVYGLTRNWSILELIENCNADVMVECSPTDLQTAQPALDYCRLALRNGKHLVLANKGPVALAYPELAAQAADHNLLIRFESTVMAGTPTIRLGMQALRGCTITEARGILNGTTNYILTQMETGLSYAEALAQAQKLGYAESDPTADVDGWDAAGKGIILARALFNQGMTLGDMRVKGIRGISQADVQTAQQAGQRWKLIVHITPQGGRVEPIRLPITDPLANVTGATNAVSYTTDLLGAVTLIGPGAGRQQTGFGLLSDLIDLADHHK
jgi:homoserine dehydrogenase